MRKQSNDAYRRLPRVGLWAIGMALLVGALFLVTGLAHAEGRPHRIVIYFEGPDAETARRDASQAIPAGTAVADDGRTNEASVRAGIRGHVATLLASAKQRKLLAPKLRQMAVAAGADAAMVGFAPKGKGDRNVPVMLVSGKNQVAFDTVVVGAGEGPADRVAKWTAFVNVAMPDGAAAPASQAAAAADSGGAAPAAQEPAAPPAAKDSPHASASATSEGDREPGADAGPTDRHGAAGQPNDPATATAILGLDYEAGFRSFSFNDPVSPNLRPYHVSGVPGVGVHAEIYPLAKSGTDVLKDIAITGRFMQAFGLESATSDGTKVDTKWREFEFGLRGRLRAGSAKGSPLLGAALTYARILFDFNEPAGADATGPLPSADYGLLRTQVDARVPIGDVSLLVGASYLAVLADSPMSGNFTHESVHGVGAELGGTVRLLPWLEGQLIGRYDRIFYKMNPEPGEQYVAGGALDQYLAINAGVSAIF